jgi:Protein of unknown function (DUF2510)
MPQEFTTVSASSYDSAALATKLTAKSAEGWDVVGIVNTSTEVTAFLSREAGTGADAATTSPASSASSTNTDPSSGSTPSYASTATSNTTATEPSGWGTAPESTTTTPSTTTPSSSSSATAAAADPSGGYSTQSTQSTPAGAASTPSVPAGWYADPAGRFDLRYWDGGTWTEHVSRAGQQFTDPPVA